MSAWAAAIAPRSRSGAQARAERESQMELTEEIHGRVVVGIARGRLDGNTSQTFAARVEKLAAVPQPRLVVDFSGVDFVSSPSLRVVLTLLKRVKAANGRLELCA